MCVFVTLNIKAFASLYLFPRVMCWKLWKNNWLNQLHVYVYGFLLFLVIDNLSLICVGLFQSEKENFFFSFQKQDKQNSHLQNALPWFSWCISIYISLYPFTTVRVFLLKISSDYQNHAIQPVNLVNRFLFLSFLFIMKSVFVCVSLDHRWWWMFTF